MKRLFLILMFLSLILAGCANPDRMSTDQLVSIIDKAGQPQIHKSALQTLYEKENYKWTPVPKPRLPDNPKPPASLTQLFQTIDSALKRHDHEIDVAYISLLMARTTNPDVLAKKYMKDLEKMAVALQPKLNRAPDIEGRIEALNLFIQNDLKYKATRASYEHYSEHQHRARNNWLNELMDSGKGNCNSLSLLYLALGHRTGFPVRAAILPRHVFVRVEDKDEVYNIEATAMIILTQSQLTAVPGYSNEKPYCTSLSNRQCIGILLNNHLAYELLGQHRFKEALACAEKALTLFPEFPDAWNARGTALRNLDKPKEALACFDMALRMDNDIPTIWHNRGNAFIELEEPENALTSYLTAWHHDHYYTSAQRNVIKTLATLGRFSEANKVANEAHDAGKESAEDLFVHACLLAEEGKDKEALPYFNKSLRLDNKNIRAWCNRGNSYARLGRFDEALSDYERATAIEPDYFFAHANKAATLFVTGKRTVAREHLEQHKHLAKSKRDKKLLAYITAGFEHTEKHLKTTNSNKDIPKK